MSECRVLDWSRAQLEPAPLDRQEAGVTDYFSGDIANDVDCEGAGVTITQAVPTIRTEDDDGELSFGIVSLTGTVFRVPYTLGSSTTQRMYAIRVDVTTSDARALVYWYSLPVVPTTPLHA